MIAWPHRNRLSNLPGCRNALHPTESLRRARSKGNHYASENSLPLASRSEGTLCPRTVSSPNKRLRGRSEWRQCESCTAAPIDETDGGFGPLLTGKLVHFWMMQRRSRYENGLPNGNPFQSCSENPQNPYSHSGKLTYLPLS